MGVAFKDFTDIKATFLIHLIFNIKDALDILPSEFYGPLICGFQRVADGIYGYTNLFWLPISGPLPRGPSYPRHSLCARRIALASCVVILPLL